jgi:protocatechuate 3,4-dioxygenase beta subunit
LGRDAAGAWVPFLGLLLGREPSAGAFANTLGALLMDAKLKVLAGAVVLAGLTVVLQPLWTAADPSILTAEPPTEVAERAHSEVPDPAIAAIDEDGARSPIAVKPILADSAVASDSTGNTARARVVDLDARPVAGASIAHADPSGGRGPSALSDELGLADVPLVSWEGWLESADDRWASVLEPLVRFKGQQPERIVVLAPRIELAGMVVDVGGTPLTGVQLSVTLSPDFRARLPLVLDGVRARVWAAESGPDGTFHLDAAAIPREQLVAHSAGYTPKAIDLPQRVVRDLRIVLSPSQPAAGWVSGIVLDEFGVPFEGARVVLGQAHARSGLDGSFGLQSDPQDRSARVLTALAPGKLPARIERTGTSSSAEGSWPDPLILRLGGPPLSMRGRVVDQDGQPVKDVAVSVLDATLFGSAEPDPNDPLGEPAYVEPQLVGDPGEQNVLTDAGGAFELRGLLPRSYYLAAWLESRGHYVQGGPFEAGRSDIVLRLPSEPLVPLIRGRVLSLAGQPVAGAGILLLRRRPELGFPTDAPINPWLASVSARTDERGRFEFHDVSSALTHLSIGGPMLGIGRQIELPTGSELEQIELRLPLRCHVQVDLTSSSIDADEFSILDATGKPLHLAAFYGSYGFSSPQHPLHDGRSEVVSASEDARALALYKQDVEVLRMPVSLVPGEVNVIKP